MKFQYQSLANEHLFWLQAAWMDMEIRALRNDGKKAFFSSMSFPSYISHAFKSIRETTGSESGGGEGH